MDIVGKSQREAAEDRAILPVVETSILCGHARTQCGERLRIRLGHIQQVGNVCTND